MNKTQRIRRRTARLLAGFALLSISAIACALNPGAEHDAAPAKLSIEEPQGQAMKPHAQLADVGKRGLRAASLVVEESSAALDAAKRELGFRSHTLFGEYIFGDEGPYRNFPADQSLSVAGLRNTRAQLRHQYEKASAQRLHDDHLSYHSWQDD